MTIKELQLKVDRWIQDIGVRYFDERTNALILGEEVGELFRLIARKYGEQSFKNQEDLNNVDENIKDELADIMFVLICLANQMDIDIESAIHENLLKKTERDQNRHKSNSKLTRLNSDE